MSNGASLFGILRDRLAEFGLTLHPDKTRLIGFGRFSAERRRDRGQGRPETFDFLGFTHCCGMTRRELSGGSPDGLKRMRRPGLFRKALPTAARTRGDRGCVASAGPEGYFAYHAVPTNLLRLNGFRSEVCRAWRHALLAEANGTGSTGPVSIASPVSTSRHAGFCIPIRRSVSLRHDLRQEPYAELCTYGSVRGAVSDGRPYRDRSIAESR